MWFSSKRTTRSRPKPQLSTGIPGKPRDLRRQGMLLTVIGILIGLLGAVAASRIVISLLYGVSRFDPTTYLLVIALLTVVSAIACWLPAWRGPG
jgi:hypothetical protein